METTASPDYHLVVHGFQGGVERAELDTGQLLERLLKAPRRRSSIEAMPSAQEIVAGCLRFVFANSSTLPLADLTLLFFACR